MDKKELNEFINMLLQLSEEKQKEIYYIMKGIKFVLENETLIN